MSAPIVPRGHLQHRTHPLVPFGPRRLSQIERHPSHRRYTFSFAAAMLCIVFPVWLCFPVLVHGHVERPV